MWGTYFIENRSFIKARPFPFSARTTSIISLMHRFAFTLLCCRWIASELLEYKFLHFSFLPFQRLTGTLGLSISVFSGSFPVIWKYALPPPMKNNSLTLYPTLALFLCCRSALTPRKELFMLMILLSSPTHVLFSSQSTLSFF